MSSRAALYLGILAIPVFCTSSLAQDTLLTVQGKSHVVKLLHVHESENLVVYQVPGADTTHQQMALSGIFLIKYGNGARQAFPQHLSESGRNGTWPLRPENLTREQLYRQGIADARTHYNSVATGLGTGALSVANPLIGLGTAAGIGAPRGDITKVPNPDLWKDPVYRFAYLTEAKRMRKTAAFMGFGIGSMAWLLLFL